MKTGNSYKDGFLRMAEDYRRLLSEEGEAFLKRAVNEKSVRDVLVTVYNILKGSGHLVELQDLSPEEKAELKGEARRLCTATDVATLMDVCRALHGFGSYIQWATEQQPPAPKMTRQDMGEAWMYCTDCNARLYSFDGSEDQGRRCPHPQKCRDEQLKT